MQRKLIKHDFLWITCSSTILAHFAITLILSILTRILSNHADSFMMDLIYKIIRGCTIAAFFSTLITCVMRVWVRYCQNVYKDEAYLTHTLPVTKNEIFNAKIVAAIASIILSFLVILACFFIAFWNNDVRNYFDIIFGDRDSIIIFVGIIITALLELVYATNCGLLGITIGHRANNDRMILSIIAGFALYFVMQGILVSIIFALGQFDLGMSALFDENPASISPEVMRNLTIVTDVLYIAANLGFYFAGKKLLSKGVNIE